MTAGIFFDGAKNALFQSRIRQKSHSSSAAAKILLFCQKGLLLEQKMLACVLLTMEKPHKSLYLWLSGKTAPNGILLKGEPTLSALLHLFASICSECNLGYGQIMHLEQMWKSSEFVQLYSFFPLYTHTQAFASNSYHSVITLTQTDFPRTLLESLDFIAVNPIVYKLEIIEKGAPYKFRCCQVFN